MDGTEPVFELADGRLAVERFDLTAHERAGSADGFLVPGSLDLFCGFTRNAVEEAFRDPNAVVLRKRERVIEDLLGRRSHGLILRDRERVGYQSAWCAFPPAEHARAMSNAVRRRVGGCCNATRSHQTLSSDTHLHTGRSLYREGGG